MEKNNIKKKVERIIKESIESVSQAKPKAKTTVVTFDKSTNPFDVSFSERGFEIDGTRLSFEFIETALSKDVNIVLKKGSGIVLDAIKMQKILKYKNLY
ncbi:MAG: hypothetical protein WC466_08025 [Candidatus Izemoplasmatales bacterium]